MRHESFWKVALCVNKRDMMIDVADSLELVRMSMMMGAAIYSYQEDSDMGPRETE